jgi:hypothetical protein
MIKELIPMSIDKSIKKRNKTKKATRPIIINDVMIFFLIFLTFFSFFKLEFFLFVLLRYIRVKQKK